MKNLYFISYDSGRGGEFIATIISEDKNFHPCQKRYVSEKNKYIIWNKNLDDLGIELYRPYKITDDQRFLIEQLLESKHIVIKTHYKQSFANLNLPNPKPIRLVYSQDFSKFFELLIWIKVHFSTSTFEPKLERFLAPDLKPIHTPIMDRIASRGYAYQWEIDQIRTGETDTTKFNLKVTMNRIARAPELPYISEYQLLDVGELYINPADNVGRWQEVFDLADPLPVNLIEDYHRANLKVIEQEFGAPYETVANDIDRFLNDYIERKSNCIS